MLAEARVSPTIPVVDLQRARQFYEGTLGLRVVQEDPSPGAMLQAGGDTRVYVYQRAATKADHTVAAFWVKDVEATVKGLKERGVLFEDVDVPGMKTVEGIATVSMPAGELKAAWFKDTEGNILAVGSM